MCRDNKCYLRRKVLLVKYCFLRLVVCVNKRYVKFINILCVEFIFCFSIVLLDDHFKSHEHRSLLNYRNSFYFQIFIFNHLCILYLYLQCLSFLYFVLISSHWLWRKISRSTLNLIFILKYFLSSNVLQVSEKIPIDWNNSREVWKTNRARNKLENASFLLIVDIHFYRFISTNIWQHLRARLTRR